MRSHLLWDPLPTADPHRLAPNGILPSVRTENIRKESGRKERKVGERVGVAIKWEWQLSGSEQRRGQRPNCGGGIC